MKKLVLILAISLCLVGCGYEETKEYPIESMRYYTKTEENKEGFFTTTTNTYEYIEFVYIDSNGKYHKITRDIGYVRISNESKVVEEEGNMTANLYLSLEDYENLLEK